MGDVREIKGESKKKKKQQQQRGVEYLREKKKWNSGILNVIFLICYVEWRIFFGLIFSNEFSYLY